MHNVTGMCVYAYRMACENGTGTCPQLSLNVDCVNLFNGFKCVCASDGYELNSDDNTCVSKSRLLRSSCLFESQRTDRPLSLVMVTFVIRRLRE